MKLVNKQIKSVQNNQDTMQKLYHNGKSPHLQPITDRLVAEHPPDRKDMPLWRWTTW